jgi:hypothetical protein
MLVFVMLLSMASFFQLGYMWCETKTTKNHLRNHHRQVLRDHGFDERSIDKIAGAARPGQSYWYIQERK